MKVILALFCCMFVAHGANVLRVARNTEAIIPSIVEEILKVELKSDLKKNSAIEVAEKEMAPEETRTIIEEPKVVVMEEKAPVIVETMIESVPQVRTVVLEEKKVPETVESVPQVRTVIVEEKKVPEIIEKVEIVAIEEKPVDNFRTESMPVVEVVKETVVVEPVVAEIRSEPVSEVMIMKEEEMIKPMVRNVVKEEIPQVEELRVIPEMDAVKDIVPEPVVSSNIVQPAVEVEPQVKTIVIETIKEEEKMPMNIEEIKMEIKSVPEMIMMTKIEETPEMMMVKAAEMIMEEKKMEEMIKDEVKSAIIEEEMKKVEKIADEMTMTMAEPAAKGVDGRQNIIQQAQQAAINTLSQVPVIGSIVQRITPTTEAVAAPVDTPAEDSPAEETADTPNEGEAPAIAAADVTTRAPGPVQQLIQNVQSGLQSQVQNVQSFFTGGTASNTATASDVEADTPRPNVIDQINQGFQQFVAGVQTNLVNLGNQVQSVIRPPTTSSPTKIDNEDTPAESVVDEAAAAVRSVVPQLAVVQPETVVVVKQEETPVEKVEMQS